MKDTLEEKTNNLVSLVVSDSRWNLEDELMVQVLGFTIYGFAFGLGRLVLFMDVEEINEVAINQLTKLGVGAKYAHGLIEAAYNSFTNENDQSIYSQLVDIGHSHFASGDLSVCVESIFSNTQALHQA
jgi:hypothetical protein